MCGIVGQIRLDERVDAAAFARMVASLAARGPDGERVQALADGRVRLGHRRLAIIDLSERGRQPLCNEDGSIWLTYNGEIYNYPALRRELEECGHVFASDCDAEVLVHGYEQWGDGLPKRLRGIFAFGIYDVPRRRLFCARDHLGVKPLYYVATARQISFASQPKALLQDPTLSRALDVEAYSDFLACGVVPHQRVIFAGMRKLLPGHTMVWEEGRCVTRAYWQLEYRPGVASFEEAVEALRTRLVETVRAQLLSDVPIATFLSGGIDSSIVTALATRELGPGTRTFTVGVEHARSDERRFARRTAEVLGTDHSDVALTLPRVLALLPDLVEAYDEPYGLGSAVPTYLVCRLAAQSGFKVALAGDGADEVFAGYLHYDAFQRERGGGPLGRLVRGARRRWQAFRAGEVYDPLASYFPRAGVLTRATEQRRLLSASAADALGPLDPLARWRRFYRDDLPPVTSAQLIDLHTFLPDEVLSKVDRAAMAQGLEVRVPFLDPELVEFVFGLDQRVVYRANERKALLKEAARDWLPADVLSQRKKGFSIPLGAWLGPALRERALAAIERGVLVEIGVLDANSVRSFLATRNGSLVWHVLMSELWAQRWLDGRAIDGDEWVRAAA